MSKEARIRAANRLCYLVEKVGVPVLLEILKAIQKDIPPRDRGKGTAILSGLARAHNLLAGFVPWEINCEGYHTPSWYRAREWSRPLNPLFLDVKVPTTHRMLPEDLIKACDIIETPLHLLLNRVVEEHNLVYKNLISYVIQISDRLPLEDYHG